MLTSSHPVSSVDGSYSMDSSFGNELPHKAVVSHHLREAPVDLHLNNNNGIIEDELSQAALKSSLKRRTTAACDIGMPRDFDAANIGIKQAAIDDSIRLAPLSLPIDEENAPQMEQRLSSERVLLPSSVKTANLLDRQDSPSLLRRVTGTSDIGNLTPTQLEAIHNALQNSKAKQSEERKLHSESLAESPSHHVREAAVDLRVDLQEHNLVNMLDDPSLNRSPSLLRRLTGTTDANIPPQKLAEILNKKRRFPSSLQQSVVQEEDDQPGQADDFTNIQSYGSNDMALQHPQTFTQ